MTDAGHHGSDEQLLALPAPEPGAPPVKLNAATGEPVKLDHLGPVIVTPSGGLERISNWDTLSEREQEVARRLIAKRNLERLKALRGEGAADAASAVTAAAADSTASDASSKAHLAPPGSDGDGDGNAKDDDGDDDDETGRDTPSPSSPTGGPYTVAVLGSGKFGTAMTVVVARNGHTVRLLTRRSEVAESINTSRRHPVCYPEIEMPPNVSATTDAAEALGGVDFVVHAVPVQSSTAFLKGIAAHIPHDAPVISLSKGICADSLNTMAEVFAETIGPDHPACFLSGPSFAGELIKLQPTGMVLAARNLDWARAAAPLFHSKTLRCYLSNDVVGVEMTGALKNVYAIAAGAAEGMGFGLNTAALLVTRANKEMRRVCLAKGARVDTVTGLAGVGDLMLTCFGSLSRNRTVGQRLGRGESLEQILATSTEVAEGVATTPAAARVVRKLGVDAPIIFAIEAVLEGKVSCRDALTKLMTRPMKEE